MLFLFTLHKYSGTPDARPPSLQTDLVKTTPVYVITCIYFCSNCHVNLNVKFNCFKKIYIVVTKNKRSI